MTFNLIPAQEMNFSIKDISGKCDLETADLLKFTGEILHGRIHFLCSECIRRPSKFN